MNLFRIRMVLYSKMKTSCGSQSSGARRLGEVRTTRVIAPFPATAVPIPRSTDTRRRKEEEIMMRNSRRVGSNGRMRKGHYGRERAGRAHAADATGWARAPLSCVLKTLLMRADQRLSCRQSPAPPAVRERSRLDCAREPACAVRWARSRSAGSL